MLQLQEEFENWEQIIFTGVQIQYFFIDPRRLWYFSKGITMEKESDLVEIGKIITQESYKRDKKEIQIGRIKIDFYRKKLQIHEVKKSSKFKDASRWQLLYYLYILKKLGINAVGILNFPKERKTEKVILDSKAQKKLEEVIESIKKIIKSKTPPKTKQSQKIKNSSYYELFMA
ncbi:MAG: CRISPR-associated protein Cas4 [Candidatus Omnitrophica bacterium]|nr:CRISPR-associated protein Cas4 [Candidatus Omnitrophota bacterium]